MRLVFKAMPVLPLYRSPNIGPVADGQVVDVPEGEATRLMADFPANFSPASELQEPGEQQESVKTKGARKGGSLKPRKSIRPANSAR